MRVSTEQEGEWTLDSALTAAIMDGSPPSPPSPPPPSTSPITASLTSPSCAQATATTSATRRGDLTLSSSSATTEEEFMQVLDEMNRICGGGDDEEEKQVGAEEHQQRLDEEDKTSMSHSANQADFADCSMLSMNASLGNLFGTDDGDAGDPFGDPPALMIDPTKVQRPKEQPSSQVDSTESPSSSQSHEMSSFNSAPNTPQHPLQASSSDLMDAPRDMPFFPTPSSAYSSTSPEAPSSNEGSSFGKSSSPANHHSGGSNNNNNNNSKSPTSRSRHCSANSSLSCVSFDSAIGDVYSVQTPPRTSFEFDQDLLDGGGGGGTTSHKDTSSSSSMPISTGSTKVSNSSSNGAATHRPPSVGQPLPLPGDQVSNQNPYRPKLSQHHSKQQHKERPHHRRPYDFPHAAPMLSSPSSAYNPMGLRRPPHYPHPHDHRAFGPYPPPPYPYGPYQHPFVHHHQEVEMVCLDLMRNFHHACAMHPKQLARAWVTHSGSDDPLLITTRLLTDALTRLRLFLLSLPPTRWLSLSDRRALYASNVCVVSILRATACADLSSLPSAYPLPYGEYLGDVEALHLVLAHDLYNELKALVEQLQSVAGMRDLPLVLLVVMVAFFRVPQPRQQSSQNPSVANTSSSSSPPVPTLQQPEKVKRIHDYYMHKLQVRERPFPKQFLNNCSHR